MPARTLNIPRAEDAERALLGILILDNKRIQEALKIIPAAALGDDAPLFHTPAHQMIFKALLSVWRRAGVVGLQLLAQELHELNQLEPVGGSAYLASLEDDVFSMEQAPELVRLLMAKWRARRELKLLGEIQERIGHGDESTEDLYRDLAALRQETRSGEIEIPNCLAAADFISTQRPPLTFHIEGLLPFGGKLTFSATSKFGKSMWAIQTGFALAAGNCEWLGWKFGPPVKVLYLQAEIMDPLLEDRLRWLLRTMPDNINHEEATRNFLIQEIALTRPCLMTAEGRARVEALLGIHKPAVLILDPLAALHPGLEENEAAAMGGALDYISGLSLRYGCAVILIHHHGKAGAARGSSVFEAWPESDLQASFLSEDDHSIAKVLMRLRCAYNPGPLYLKMPAPESPWFERMPEGWEPERRGGRPKSGTPEVVTLILRESGPLKWKQLQEKLIDIARVGATRAQELIKEAVSKNLVAKGAGIYSAITPNNVSDVSEVRCSTSP